MSCLLFSGHAAEALLIAHEIRLTCIIMLPEQNMGCMIERYWNETFIHHKNWCNYQQVIVTHARLW